LRLTQAAQKNALSQRRDISGDAARAPIGQ
jgi:hypothetical protein